MARNNKARWLGLAITTIMIIVAVVTSFIWVQADVKAVDMKATVINENMDELKEEGCLPARDNGDSIIGIKAEVKTLSKEVTEMRTEQKAGFREILKRLPDK